ncbi:MAG: prephenate dehydratase domain-containing protein [Eubacteriales bacterium]|nr:prephenate dehydratase domain-containing protein [Eubacteriales bacterium]
MIRIGYQGIEGANAEQAAHDLVEKVGITEEVKYVPLVDSEHVINALVSKDINYGVCAIYNSVAGIVLETVAATNGVELYIKADTTLNIHHCMFKKSPDIPDNNLTAVASHVLAIKQCEEHLHELYPQLAHIEVEDTGKAAKDLADGTLSDTTAVLCRKNAGELFGLTLMNENIEDFPDNRTHFCLFQLKPSTHEVPSLFSA